MPLSGKEMCDMKYHFKIHKEGKGYWAQCIEFSGCITEAHSMNQLRKNMEEALNLYLDEPINSDDIASLPKKNIKKSKNIIEVDVDPNIAFAFLIRYYRITHGLTQQEAAKKMGFDTIYSYQRLETKKCNPGLKIISKVKQIFPDFSIDLVLK